METRGDHGGAWWRRWDCGGEQHPRKGREGQRETTIASWVLRGTTAESGDQAVDSAVSEGTAVEVAMTENGGP